MRLAVISVDLDEIPNYFAIYGLGVGPRGAANAVYDRALARLSDLASGQSMPLTLFVIAADLARRENAERLKVLAGAGHELGNHSLDHLYDLTRRDPSEIRRQVQSAITVIEGATGVRPRGFRAPGYTVSDELFEILMESGVEYDSSVFPCPPYYLAKAARLATIRLRRRRSHSILDTPQVLRAPTRPYRVGTPYWRAGQGMLELPIQVTRGPRLPYIGTTLTLAGPDRARWLTRSVIGEPLINLELHGIDVLAADDGLEDLLGFQPDVGVSRQRKLDTFDAVVTQLKRAGYSFVRLDEAARRFSV